MKRDYKFFVECYVKPAQQLRLQNRYAGCDDAQLLNDAREGSEDAALYLFFVRYGIEIASIACKHFFEDDAEQEVLSVMRDAFMECCECRWENLMQHAEHAGAFLAGMVRNKALKKYRDDKRYEERLGNRIPYNEDGVYEGKLSDWVEMMEEEEHLRKLEQLDLALDTIPEAERFVLRCKFKEGMGMEKIAEILPREFYPARLRGLAMKITPYAVKQMYESALDMLRTEMDAA